MNAAVLLVIAFAVFFLAYRFYGSFIAALFEENDSNQTPAAALKDDVDYVPTKPLVLFGHHFAKYCRRWPDNRTYSGAPFRIYACMAVGCYRNYLYRRSP